MVVKAMVNGKAVDAETEFFDGYYFINMTGHEISIDKEDGAAITIPDSGLPKLEATFDIFAKKTEGKTEFVEMIASGPRLNNVPVVIGPSLHIFLLTKEDAVKVSATEFVPEDKIFANHAYVLLAEKDGDDHHYAAISKI